MQINFQQQPTGDTCTSACLAMLAGCGVHEVIEEFHEDWKKHSTTPGKFLDKKGIAYRQYPAWDAHTYFGNLYLLTVPSLNIEGGLHHIILDLRDEETDEVLVFDPNRGKHGKRYYQGWDKPLENDHAVVLHAWVVDLVLIDEKEKEQANG